MFWLIFLLLFFLSPQPILASDFNSFGLHLTQPSDIDQAATIINSSGGDWGYATITIRGDQLDKNVWQDFFNKCRQLHIIPIIRLATVMENNSWQIPTTDNIDQLAIFLNSLNWPMIPQYIIPFNEVNHAKEWGGGVDIKTFTDLFIYTSQKFKSLNPNFFILSSPLDLAAPQNPPLSLSAANVYRQIYQYNPQYFDSFDGLASHSYPNYGFIGLPGDQHAHSIKGYAWELNFIKNLGINKTYPVFITETGWPHREGVSKNNRYYTVKTSAEFLKQALNIWGQDTRVKAVTPFIYNYPDYPFDHFSWLKKDGSLYPEYQAIINLPKKKNNPQQITAFEVYRLNLPLLIFSQKTQHGNIHLKNTGQSIWGETQLCLHNESSPNISTQNLCTDTQLIQPGRIQKLNFTFTINSYLENTYLKWQDTPEYPIKALNPNSSLYHPKDSFLSQLKNRILGFFR